MQVPLRRYWTLLVSYLKPQWPRVALLALVLLGGIGLELLNPQILRSFIDTAVAGGATSALTRAALLFVGVAVLQQVLSVLTTYVGGYVGWTATNALRIDVAAHCLRLDLSFHKARTPGEMIERVDGDINALSNFFSRFVISLFGNFLLMIGVLVLLFREDWRAGAALSIFALVTLLVLTRLHRFAVPYAIGNMQAAATFFGFLGEQLTGTEDVRANGASGYVMHRFYELMRAWLPAWRGAGMSSFSLWGASILLFALGNAIAFGLGAYLWSINAISIGTVYLIFTYTELLRRPIEQIRTQIQSLQQGAASIERVEELLNTRSKIEDGKGTPLPPGALPVAFDAVSFVYDDQRPAGPQAADEAASSAADQLVLRDVSFALRPGEVLGLLGRTGSGKTTIARLLLRLYDVSAGEVRLGDVPIGDARLDELRRRVGIVTQDVQLFRATVRDNLTFYDRSIPDARIIAVLDDLGLGPWYRALPHGLDTELESNSGGLSGGEAQLLAFTRLFLADPSLVILDEASSRLDPATEQLIERAVTRLLWPDGGRRTAIIIAHRLTTIQRADTILILEDGQIVEYGAREQLQADPASRFATLLRTGMEEVLA